MGNFSEQVWGSSDERHQPEVASFEPREGGGPDRCLRLAVRRAISSWSTKAPVQGMTGYFTRNGSGAVSGIHLGGRLARRV